MNKCFSVSLKYRRTYAIIGLFLLLMTLPNTLFAFRNNEYNSGYEQWQMRCNYQNFCSRFLVGNSMQYESFTDDQAEVRAFRPKWMGLNEFNNTHYYATIAANPITGDSGTAERRGGNQIKQVRGPNPRRTFEALFYTEKAALNRCSGCEVIVSFRDGCAAIAWDSENKRIYRAIEEYHPNWRPITTSGRNPRVRDIEHRALEQCHYNCHIIESICTRDSY